VKKKKNISQNDLDTWQEYVKNPTDITDKDKLSINVSFSNQRFRFDLHGYTLIDANRKVKEIILLCIQKKIKEILLITGKGIHSNTDNNIYASKDFSKLKYSVPEYINSNCDLSKHVLSVSNANKTDGGAGAIVIKLRNL
jgi:DNA-nicking Smr family endonuclease|tara:strand:+ start:1367 stop:1786 length:420 start_codon:yes stop_codon:yes gene_type:complete